jgi:hypothetical protein
MMAVDITLDPVFHAGGQIWGTKRYAVRDHGDSGRRRSNRISASMPPVSYYECLRYQSPARLHLATSARLQQSAKGSGDEARTFVTEAGRRQSAIPSWLKIWHRGHPCAHFSDRNRGLSCTK